MNETAPAPSPSAVRATVANGFRDFRDAVAGSFVPLDVGSLGAGPFWGRLRTVDVDTVHVTDVKATRHTVERTPLLIAANDPHFYKASLQVSGTGLLIQDGREALLQPGDLAIYDTNRPYSLVFEDDIRMLVLMFPRESIGLPPEMVGQLTAHRFSSDDGLGGMIIPFLNTVSQNIDRVGGLAGPRLVQKIGRAHV